MQQCLLSYDNNTTLYAVMVRLKCLLGGKDTVMVDWSVYNDGSGLTEMKMTFHMQVELPSCSNTPLKITKRYRYTNKTMHFRIWMHIMSGNGYDKGMLTSMTSSLPPLQNLNSVPLTLSDSYRFHSLAD